MSPTSIVDVPTTLGILPDAVVAKYLSRGMQAGQENPPRAALLKAAVPLPENGSRWHTEPVRELCEEAMRRFEDRRVHADAWLAPRLHATIRMTRAEAAERGLWNYLAMLVAPDYVVWRHKGSEVAETTRFSGRSDVQAFARLWWAAELFRDGADYGPVATVFAYQDIVNSVMRSGVIDHRPAAAAMLRVIQRLVDEKVARVSDHVNALSRAANAAGSTLMFDVLAPDTPTDSDAHRGWIAESAHAAAVQLNHLPDGPDDGVVNRRSVEELVPLFEKFLAEAPLRDRSKEKTESA
ncbi:DUF6339 family protein [Amycolatopsis sp., V23-08]|uniref:DUF6339 family protein n=1 Tax=Amycolatopsis heterodermiae TaxID=3110235 RepID=A0ABU5R0M0_9PSEU|nr:DUF6339 family protein [Amycolatopsis sp., V23-08]MEA5359703.1 DUF6339 family protein [Amycolatopsis sp., V23-08]